jgi:type VI secretion system secreted protein Hcp
MTLPLAGSAPSANGSDIFLRVQTKRAGKVKGESTAPEHEGDIMIAGWNWGLSSGSAVGSGAGTARRSYKHLTVFKAIDSASTALMSALATNDEVKEARLAMRRAGEEQVDYFAIVLGGARVTALELTVDDMGTPVERVEFAFTKVEVEYRRQEGSGQAGASSSFEDDYLPG